MPFWHLWNNNHYLLILKKAKLKDYSLGKMNPINVLKMFEYKKETSTKMCDNEMYI